MGIEPTQDGTSALLTVLKTAEPTRTLPPPQAWRLPGDNERYHILFSFLMEVPLTEDIRNLRCHVPLLVELMQIM